MGYSSLGYLRKFPFDKIKIDRSFVRVLGDGRPGDVAVVRAIVALGHGLGMTTTAEGVETADQAARLRAEGCDEMQGYLFSPPQPADVVGAMIAREGRARSPAPPAGEAGPARLSA